jgi:hypothetical protein
LSAITSPIGSIYARTGNGLYQDLALRTEREEETQTPILYKETQSIIAVIPTCDAPINDDRHLLNWSVGAIDLQKDSEYTQPLSGWSDQGESGHKKRGWFKNRLSYSFPFKDGRSPKDHHSPASLGISAEGATQPLYSVHPRNRRHPSFLSSTSSEGLRNSQQRSAHDGPAFNVPPSVTAAADSEATIRNDECALDPVSQGTVNSISNFSQITGDEPASGLTEDCLWKNPHTKCSMAIPVTESSTSVTQTYARHSPPIPRRTDQSDSSKGVNSDNPSDNDYVHIDIDDRLSNIETQPRPTKRRRIGAFLSQKRYAAQSIISATRQNQSDNQSQVTKSWILSLFPFKAGLPA